MTDELQLLAASDPAPRFRWPRGPLDDAAERHLLALLSGERQASPRTVRRRVTATRTALTIAAAGVAALVVVVTSGSGAPTGPVPVAVQPVAAPAPLAVDAEATMPSLAGLAALAAERAAGSPPSAAVRGSHVRTWYLGFGAVGEGFPAVVLPEERLSAAHADGGLTVTRVSADPMRPAEVLLGADSPAPEAAMVQAVTAAELVGDPAERTPPPAEPSALATHLAAIRAPAPPDGPELLSALEQVLIRWTPGPAEDAAIASWLAQQPGLFPLGAVTDRLGRPGMAYALDTTRDGATFETRHTVVLNPATGAILSIELAFLEDTGEWDVEPYAVISYVAYRVT